MTGPVERPPQLARRLLERLLPARDRVTLPAELDEIFARRVERHGRARARWWYRGQVVSLAIRLAADRRREPARAHTTGVHFDAWATDLRHGVRSLLRRPGFTLVAALSLALGIGANTAMFSVVNALLLRELPVADPDRWVELYTSDEGGNPYATFSYPDIRDLRDQGRDVFSDVIAFELFLNPMDRDGETTMVMGELVSGNFFSSLGVRPYLGRLLAPSDDADAGSAAVLVLSHAFWMRELGGDPAVLGRSIVLGQTAFEVVGIAPPDFRGMYPGLVAAAWAPTSAVAYMKGNALTLSDRLDNRRNRSTFVKGRLADGVTLAQANAWLGGFSLRLQERFPESNRKRAMVALGDVAIHPIVDRALVPVATLLMAVVGLVLLIACVNLASFLLARAEDRRREVALRLALGARRGGLIRRFLTETLLLALVGGAGGVVLAGATLDLLAAFQPPLMVPLKLDIPIDRTVLFFTCGVSLAAGLFFGLIPALQATRPDLAPVLKGPGGRRSLRGSGLRDTLVVTQIAFSFLLLVGAGLFVRSAASAREIDPGFYTGNAAIISPNLAFGGVDDEASQREFWAMLEERLSSQPGIDGVTMTDALPLGANVQTTAFEVPGAPATTPDGRHHIDMTWVSSAYFDVMDVPIVRGRGFGPEEGGGRVAVVSQAMAARLWPGQDPIGRTLTTREGVEIAVVGVARDTKVRTLGEAPRPRIYFSTLQNVMPSYQVVVRGGLPSTELLRIARATARSIRPDLVFMETKTMEQHLALMLFPPRMAALLLAAFGGLALVLSAIGIYGVVSYTVARRTREVGIRMSVGASPADAVRFAVGGGMRLVALGGIAGTALAAGGALLLGRFLYGIQPLDPVTFTAIPALLGLVALGAAWVPARAASRVDPARALRAD